MLIKRQQRNQQNANESSPGWKGRLGGEGRKVAKERQDRQVLPRKRGLSGRRVGGTGEDEVDVARPRGRHMEGPLTVTLDSHGEVCTETGINGSRRRLDHQGHPKLQILETSALTRGASQAQTQHQEPRALAIRRRGPLVTVRELEGLCHGSSQ